MSRHRLHGAAARCSARHLARGDVTSPISVLRFRQGVTEPLANGVARHRARQGSRWPRQTLRLDEATRPIPILICSSDPNEVKRRAGHLETMPNVDVLAKPFDPEALLARMAQMMDGRGPAWLSLIATSTVPLVRAL